MSRKRGRREKWSKFKEKDEGEKDLPKFTGKYAEVFQEYRKEIDLQHDKYERLVKLSRDCTMQSKRAIFTLHQFSGGEENKEKILHEAKKKINTDVLPLLHSIALEISGEDPHKYHRAFSPGLQEFIEAVAFYKYLRCERLVSLGEVQEYLTFQTDQNKDSKDDEFEKTDKCKDIFEEDTDKIDKSGARELDSASTKFIILPLCPSDFILGLADLTGELMRLCINSVGSGNRDLPFSLLPFYRALYCGFHMIGPGIKFMNQKMTVLRSSLGKVENVCYTLKVRGSEIPKHMLMDMLNTTSTSMED